MQGPSTKPLAASQTSCCFCSSAGLVVLWPAQLDSYKTFKRMCQGTCSEHLRKLAAAIWADWANMAPIPMLASSSFTVVKLNLGEATSQAKVTQLCCLVNSKATGSIVHQLHFFASADVAQLLKDLAPCDWSMPLF